MKKLVMAMLLAMALVVFAPPLTLHADDVTEKGSEINIIEEELNAEAAAVISIEDEQVALAGGNPVEIKEMGIVIPLVMVLSAVAGLGFVILGSGVIPLKHQEA